jgi:2-C-methyl-D-erythritol 2,4-cyclodiphosphate synthase
MSMNPTSTARTILFWISIVFLGIMLWRLVSANKSPTEVVSYSEFLQMIDDKEILTAKIYLEANSANVYALLRRSQKYVQTTIATSELPEITARLKDAGAKIEISEVKSGDWTLILLNAAPLILLAGFCFFLMRQMQGKWRRTGVAILGSPRTGIGYDLHRLEEGRPLIVGGIELPFDKGPVGHSDGDVLAHAICDALLGAAGLGDIGTHFPDTDAKWKGTNSLIFLERTKKLLDEKKFAIEHVDAVVITEKPKLGPHFPKMREALAGALGVGADKIHLKAKTNEGVDAIGRGEAIAAHVVATLSSR